MAALSPSSAIRIFCSAGVLLLLPFAGCGSGADPAPTPNNGGAGGGSAGGPSGGRGGAGPSGSGGAVAGSGGGAAGSAGSGGGASGAAGQAGGPGAQAGSGGGQGAAGSGPAGGAGGASGADAGLPVCDYPAWTRTASYKAGDIVMHNGKPFIAKFDNQSLEPEISTYYWGDYQGCMPPPPPPPAACPALDRLLPAGEASFKTMFTPTFQGWVPLPAYSYAGLCKAMQNPAVSGFASSGNDVQDKRELAAFFANVAIETAYLTYTDENGFSPSANSYHGRGSLQLTGRANYQSAGQALGLDLAGMPQLGSQESVVWVTGLWYWMRHANPSVGGAQICHQAIAGGDFGRTVRIIKGDCASSGTRAGQYQKNCTLLGVDPGKTSCP